MSFLEANGNITAPATTAAQLNDTATVGAQSPIPTLDFARIQGTRTQPRICLDFRVKVVRARIRECPKDTCNTITMPAQGARICVYGPATEDPDWYEINVDPGGPVVRTGYMHNSVVEAVNPTKRPTITPTFLPSVTSVPTATFTRTPSPEPTDTPNPLRPPPGRSPGRPPRSRRSNRPDYLQNRAFDEAPNCEV